MEKRKYITGGIGRNMFQGEGGEMEAREQKFKGCFIWRKVFCSIYIWNKCMLFYQFHSLLDSVFAEYGSNFYVSKNIGVISNKIC